jgi:hypothetical protein
LALNQAWRPEDLAVAVGAARGARLYLYGAGLVDAEDGEGAAEAEDIAASPPGPAGTSTRATTGA